MNQENKGLIIFDFDGVLVNTIPFCFSLHKKYNPDLTWEKFQGFSDGNFIHCIKDIESKNSHIIPENFREKYQKNIDELEVIDVLSDIIVSLNKDHLISIVSSTPTAAIKNFLIKKDLNKYFSDILGADIHSDKTVKINSLLDKYGISPENTVFVTDSLGDILEGNKSKVHSIGVTWGIHPKENLAKGNPESIIDNPTELLEAIQNVLK